MINLSPLDRALYCIGGLSLLIAAGVLTFFFLTTVWPRDKR